jgi:serine phosphatase RsbU (regulator of sigma subunit)
VETKHQILKMKFRFTIGRKIGTGFGILLFFTILVFFVTKNTLDVSKKLNEENTIIHAPTVDKLQELKILIIESKIYITNWASVQSSSESQEKVALKKLMYTNYPELRDTLIAVSIKWSEEEKLIGDTIFLEIGTLFSLYEDIMGQIVAFESYYDPEIMFLSKMYIEQGGDIDIQLEKVLDKLDELIKRQRENTDIGSKEMISKFKVLEFLITNIGIALFIGGILIAFLTIRTIVNPVQKFKTLLLLLGKGIIPEERMKPRSDEIGEMAIALNDLVSGFKRTAEFAGEVGSGNFESEYKPLSEKDSLGHSLIMMRKNLWELTSNLEQKVKERTEEVVRQKVELESQKHEIEELLKEVTDSIHYAKRIQNAILPKDSFMKKLVPQSFVLFKPKDIVSGDFYWVTQMKGKAVFAAVDCTGHGVPGALMTIVGYNKLNQAAAQITSDPDPASILDGLNKGVIETFTHDGSEAEIKDGMDAAMCVIDSKNRTVQFAGAFNPLYLIKKGSADVEEIKGDKFPIGAFIGGQQSFTNHTFQLEEGDTFYLFSDGYADQFGGEKGKKFRYKNLRDLLISIQDKSMEEQRTILDTTIENWKGNLEQIDDILVMGFRM